eukprot:CAMPEP_0117748022 /NCGR_PEP_ID=MMETSP0947-20121206/8837_1 /TAXON_ID=44440 /ORGANISM="Chattonella subsalsa, Strain CCMP2191" /LENGTH=330 /DNA_ID=CAMNT_0005565543 /DNA_START=159 /DNA_END=1148 /DNA_ORIENTATION=-
MPDVISENIECVIHPPSSNVPSGLRNVFRSRDVQSFFYDAQGLIREYACTIKGKKNHPNEDRFVVSKRLETSLPMPNSTDFQSASLYAVIDGHGGSGCAEHIFETLETKIAETESLKKITMDNTLYFMCEALEHGLIKVEEEFLKICKNTNDTSGAVIVVAIELAGWLCVANIGDSEAMLLDHRGKQVKMSTMHSSRNPKEILRIKKTGARIRNGYIMNKLQPSRTIGDSDIKQITSKVILAKPVIHVTHLKKHKEGTGSLILACDGFWDIGKRKAGKFISKHVEFWAKCVREENMQAYHEAGYIDPANSLAEFAKKNGSRDDITVVFVK